MTAATLTLTEFLLARIAEDEEREWLDASERAAIPLTVYKGTTVGAFKAVSFAARRVPACLPIVQRAMAIRYADHPDYRDEWRP